MKLAILHYHLNPGGVTRVIAGHLQALAATAQPGERLDVLLLFDGQRDGWPRELAGQLPGVEIAFCPIAGLRYQDQPVASAAELTSEIEHALSAHGFTAQNALLHVHNHSLGKNAAVPLALRHLAGQGFGLLLQPHDFAEDFRPDLYRHLADSLGADRIGPDVYFQGPRVYYATLNRRDFEILRRAGIDEKRLHFLPNPVADPPPLPDRDEARRALYKNLGVDPNAEYILYPVRGIRRKNLGEFVLLSVLRNHQLRQQAGSVWGLTLAPLNPRALPYYDRWRQLVNELALPCRFDVGGSGGLTFAQNLAAADRIATTSVAEGFGMVFLESWLADRTLIGRNLPEITADFLNSGLRLDTLYDRLDVPVDWVGFSRVIDAVASAARNVYEAYRLPVPSRNDVAEAIESGLVDGRIDFGRLDEDLQQEVVRRVAVDEGARDELLAANPSLQTWDSIDEALLRSNQTVVRQSYSLGATGQRLRGMYNAIRSQAGETLETPADGSSLLNAFLDLNRFRLIRT